MQVFIRILIPLVVFLILKIINYFIKTNAYSTKKGNYEHIIIVLPKIWCVIGWGGSVFFFGLSLLTRVLGNHPAEWWTTIVFMLFGFVGVYLVIACSLYKIELSNEDDFFIFRTCFGRNHKIFYRNCISYIMKNNSIVLKTKDKEFKFYRYSAGIDKLVSLLNTNSKV